MVKQLPRGQRRGAGLELVFEAYPQTVSQEGDHDVGFDPFGGKVPDRADSQVAFERAEDGFDFSERDVLGPKLGRIACSILPNAALTLQHPLATYSQTFTQRIINMPLAVFEDAVGF